MTEKRRGKNANISENQRTEHSQMMRKVIKKSRFIACAMTVL